MERKMYPKWSELPNLDLYLDQVLIYINQLDSFTIIHNEKGLTAAMVNNYVKNGFVDKPIKKKYNRRQLARLIVISCLKNVFSIQEISKTVSNLTRENQSDLMYDNFVACMNDEENKDIPEVIIMACETVKLYQKTHNIVANLE